MGNWFVSAREQLIEGLFHTCFAVGNSELSAHAFSCLTLKKSQKNSAQNPGSRQLNVPKGVRSTVSLETMHKLALPYDISVFLKFHIPAEFVIRSNGDVDYRIL